MLKLLAWNYQCITKQSHKHLYLFNLIVSIINICGLKKIILSTVLPKISINEFDFIQFYFWFCCLHKYQPLFPKSVIMQVQSNHHCESWKSMKHQMGMHPLQYSCASGKFVHGTTCQTTCQTFTHWYSFNIVQVLL